MADAIIDGFIVDQTGRQEIESCLYSIENDMCDPSEATAPDYMEGSDDVTGESIAPDRIRSARREELRGFDKQNVYTRVPRWWADSDPEGVKVGVRWVDRLKGEEVRSRLVAQEFSSRDKDGLFAATPPLGAARSMVSMVASQGAGGPGGWKVMLLDVKKAFLYGDITRSVYIELPEEDPGREGGA